VAVVVLILVFVPPAHESLSFVFTHKVNNSGYADGSLTGGHFWFLVLPLGFLLTQYTITGFDASAHLSEETNAASMGAAKGIWRSIFYSAVGGWIILLAFLFAVQDPDAITAGGGGVDLIFGQALGQNWHVLVLAISAAGQFFCTVACLTSASRMTFAFSRDGAIPGSKMLSKVTAARVPANAVIFVAVIGAIITLPALIKVDINGAPVPVAFYAVVSVAVIGLYLAFLIPIWLRWKMGDAFEPGAWNNGKKYKWMNLVAVVEIAIICVYFILPFTPAAIPGNEDFSWKFVNYAPILTIGSLLILTIWWQVSAKNWFTGPKHTIDPDVVNAFED
jgi:amino acid transporter